MAEARLGILDLNEELVEKVSLVAKGLGVGTARK